MDKKLTLTIQEDLVKFAHKFAKETNQSISNIVEKYLASLKEKPELLKLGKNTKFLTGILKGNKALNKKEIRKLFYEKSSN